MFPIAYAGIYWTWNSLGIVLHV